jgi:hypothetical protein
MTIEIVTLFDDSIKNQDRYRIRIITHLIRSRDRDINIFRVGNVVTRSTNNPCATDYFFHFQSLNDQSDYSK